MVYEFMWIFERVKKFEIIVWIRHASLSLCKRNLDTIGQNWSCEVLSCFDEVFEGGKEGGP